MDTVYYGPVINPQSLTCFQALPRCLLAVAPNGNIAWMEPDVPSARVQEVLHHHGLLPGNYPLIKLQSGEFIMPGLVDTHIHACQAPIVGLGGQDELLHWLENSVFPAEKKFKDRAYAERVYPDVVKRVINSGTTTSCYYGTLHCEATKVLAKTVFDKGQRAFVGKCNMDRNSPPDYIEPSAQVSLDATKAVVDYIRHLPSNSAGEHLVRPIITPRFALSCTEELLTDLGRYAHEKPGIPIQTHISENRAEVEEVLELFGCTSYAGVYDKFHLLRHNTILGHGVWLTDEDIELIAKRGAGVAHCPASNFYLSSGMAQVGKLLDRGVKVGLGTDVSGGNNPSLLYTIQMASTASKMIAIGQNADKGDGFTDKKLRLETLLYLATMGGAEVCCLQDRIGSFKPGKAFDALHVSIRDDTGNPAIWGYNPVRDLADEERQPNEEELKEWLERFFFGGDSRNIRRVIVQGALIGGQEFHR